jgi:hypothetical protein
MSITDTSTPDRKQAIAETEHAMSRGEWAACALRILRDFVEEYDITFAEDYKDTPLWELAHRARIAIKRS